MSPLLSRRQQSRRHWLVGVALVGGLLSVLPGDLMQRMTTECLVEADTKKCACPLAPGESVFIPCSSANNHDSCGACSVLSADGTRSGRTCITIQ
ncbi:MAG: hypothetical protein HY595_03000 [Candidatus Omnitrophica bacterium]|nr:hypothetical protein [Candidatus Omnitrophota bacterium]